MNTRKKIIKDLPENVRNDIIKFAWHDRTSFDKIKDKFGFTETEVVRLMRRELKESSFIKWKERISGRKSKHRELHKDIIRFRKGSRKIKHRDVINNMIETWKDG